MSKEFALSKNTFGGIDQRAGCSTSFDLMPELCNFFIDERGALKKRNGYRRLTGESGEMTASKLWNVGGSVFMTVGNELYKLVDGEFINLGGTTIGAHSVLGFADKIYALAGNFYTIDGNTLAPEFGYVPLVLTACAPNGAGTVLESPNMLNNRRRVRFNGDGNSCTYVLPEKNLNAVISVTLNGETAEEGYTAALKEGTVTFDTAPADGINNVEICYAARNNPTTHKMIVECRYGLVFENRLFLYGNPSYPNYLFHSAVADGIPCGEYFTETDYHIFDEPVISLSSCFNRIIVFLKNSAFYSYSQLNVDSKGNARTTFPVYELNSSKGSLIEGNAVSYGNMPVTLCEDGLNRWTSTEIADERTASVFSHRVYGYMDKAKSEIKDLRIMNRKSRSELWLILSEGVLIYNYGLDLFYFYDIGGIRAVCEYEDGIVFSLKDGGTYLFTEGESTDDGKLIKATFSTPFCTFSSPHKLKSLNCVGLTVESGKAFVGDLTVKRGNLSESNQLNGRLFLSEIAHDACRRIKARLPLKRFYSCKITLSTCSDGVYISGLYLFGKELDGNLRNN